MRLNRNFQMDQNEFFNMTPSIRISNPYVIKLYSYNKQAKTNWLNHRSSVLSYSDFNKLC